MERLFSAQTKRIALVVLAVTLVALAGCSTGDDGGDTPAPNGTLTETPTPEPTAEPTPDPTPDPAPDRDIDPAELASSHAAQIDAATSLSTAQQVVFEQRLDGNTSVVTSGVSGAYDLQASVGTETYEEVIQSSLQRMGRSTDVYTAGNETFLRQNSTQTSEPQYGYGQQPYNESTEPSPVAFSNIGWVGVYQQWNASLESQGQTEFRGQTVTEYRAEGIADLPVITQEVNDSFASFDSANATSYVTDDGLVTYTRIDITGTSTDGGSLSATLQYSVSDVNATTVEEPDWTDQVNTTG